MCIVRDHILEIKEVDKDKHGMKGFGDHRVPIIGQVTFWYQARRFAKKKLVKALVSDTETRELRWMTMVQSHFTSPPPKPFQHTLGELLIKNWLDVLLQVNLRNATIIQNGFLVGCLLPSLGREELPFVLDW